MAEEHDKKVLEELVFIRWTLLSMAIMLGLMLLLIGLAFLGN